MKYVKAVLAAMSSAVVFGIPPQASAETRQQVQTEVDISMVKNAVAKNINADVSQIPDTVGAPLDVAAKVCNVPADTLRQQVRNESGGCTAETTSPALDQIVQRLIKGGRATVSYLRTPYQKTSATLGLRPSICHLGFPTFA